MAKHKQSNFQWPEFNTDRDRIKANSLRYANMSVIEAFESAYKMKLTGVSELANELPREMNIGDILRVSIRNISKNKVDFDVPNSKSAIHSSVNLFKYSRFKYEVPTEQIPVRIINIDKHRGITVDPLSPMVEDWMEPVVRHPELQKVLVGATPIKVKNLQLTRGGFLGEAVIPTVSRFVGEDFTIPAFIPGSQIVLNITDNFEQFVGKEVDTFVLNYMKRPGTEQMTLICSAKEFLKFKGEKRMIDMFNNWCEGSDTWKDIENTTIEGEVTGIINSSKKCGVFVEIPEWHITGMVSAKPEELVNYKPHQKVQVKIAGFDEETYYNQFAKQTQHVEPYRIEKGILLNCNLKPILKFA